MKKMKKLALGFGMLTTVIAPVAVAISCDEESPTKKPVDDSPVLAPVDDSPVPAPFDFTNDLALFNVLGITEPVLSPGVTATYDITPNHQTGVLIVTVTLTKGNETTSKDVILTTLLGDVLALFNDVSSSKDKADLMTAIEQANQANDAITSNVLGIIEPTLTTAGITATYAITTPFNYQTGVVIVGVTLTKGTETVNKDIIITAPPIDFTNDLSLLNDVSSSKDKADLMTAINQANQANDPITPDVLGITEPTLSPGVTATYYGIITPHDQTGVVIVGVTLTKGIEIATKFIIISSFAFTEDLARFTNTSSSKTTDRLLDAIILAKGVITPDVLGITEPVLPPGVTATYAISSLFSPNDQNDQTNAVTVTVTLTKWIEIISRTDTASKKITIRPASPFDFDNDLDLFTNTPSSKDEADLISAIEQANQANDAITSNVLGINEPPLSPGVTATYAITTPFNDQTGVVIVGVTLTKGNKILSKKITIRPASPFDFANDLALFNDVSSSKHKVELTYDINQANDAITANVLGITEPTLTPGTIATYAITTPFNNQTGVVIVTVTFTKGTAILRKSITITAQTAQESFNFTEDLRRFWFTTHSSKNASDLKTAILSAIANGGPITPITPNILGINEPYLSPGVTATYVIKYAIPLYNGVDPMVLVTLTLTKGTATTSKDITIIPTS
ncbi:lipoprotein 17-related variable surface protein [Candidatus Mycoplasma mahonii]|uniref:lipoprotein 17-related variable surface protein n=1 Tax=Candidatus Mycoplasma mahonii TaxID=3004105 RepID=UPI0026EF1F89|nr:lipoprotein 17-related variable surface protein [Candidatus Mycoplasma mahonii]WKX02375.1 lipoprotein 17-related variable surface protein [Candidatus Mycoplasma mahonii]